MWLGIVSLFVACIVITRIGRRATAGELPRNHTAGLRTPATLADDEAWDVGNRVAGPSTVLAGIGGGVAVIGVAAIQLAGASPEVVGSALVLATLLVAALVLLGAVRGHRAAADLLASRDA